ncbi:MAG: response regulator [Phycisphaeraceae bacterium]|nr:response regulator [Phycisphaeraceae bacterium]
MKADSDNTPDPGLIEDRLRESGEQQPATESLSQAMNSAVSGIIIVDEQCVIEQPNAYFLDVLECRPERLQGKPLREWVHMQDRAVLDAMIESIVRDQICRSETIRFTRDDLTIMPLLVNCSVLESDNDGSMRIAIHTADIRDRLFVENELRLNEQKYRAMFEESPVSFFEVDVSLVWDALQQPEYKVLFSNPCQQDKLARMVRLVNINRSAVTLYQADSKVALLAQQDSILLSQGSFISSAIVDSLTQPAGSFEADGQHKTLVGELKHVLLKWNIPADFEQKAKKIQVSIMDVTAWKQLEADKETLSTQLNRSQRLETIGTLAGGIAHDFNNILTPILGYVDMALIDLGPSHPLQDDLTRVSEAALRAKELVNHMLTFSRQIDTDPVPVAPADVIHEVVRFVRHSIPSNIKINQVIHDEKITVLADPTQIHQVLLNLCTNAFLAMQNQPQGALEIEQCCIEVDPHLLERHPDLKLGRYVRLSVKDTGAGITPHDVEHVFEPFFSTRDIGEGTGLGLSVAHGIVKAHHGTISVTSEIGTGTVFHVYLPLSTTPLSPPALVPMSMPRGVERVMVIDDEAPVVDLVSKMLQRLGYTVKAFTESVDAVKAFERSPGAYDLVISDMTMPFCDGAKVAHCIKKVRPPMPVILMTGFSHVGREDLLKQGAIQAIVEKPILSRDVARTIRAVLDNHLTQAPGHLDPQEGEIHG